MSEIGTPPTGGKSQTQDVQLRIILGTSLQASELEGQDPQYHIELIQRMLQDLIHEGDLATPISNYIRHYINGIESDNDEEVADFLRKVDSRIIEDDL
jgi:hypothetical protein